MEYLNLTSQQQNIWLVEVVNKNTNINTISGIFYIKDDMKFDYNVHNNILNRLVRENDALRFNIVMQNNTPMQYVKEFTNFNAELINTIDLEIDIEKYMKNETDKPIDIFGNSLFEFKIIRFEDNRTGIFYKFHHIISDAWSLIEFASEYANCYDSYINDKIYEVKNNSYLDYISSEKQYINSEKYNNDEKYWNEYLKEYGNSISIKDTTKKINNKADRYSYKLEKSLNDKLFEYCESNKISPYTLFMAALSTYIYRISERDDIVIGTPILNRSNFKEKKTLGLFISTMPLRIKVDENIKFIDLAKSIGSNIMSSFRHQKFPYSKVLQNTYSNSNSKENIYKILLSYQNARADYPDKDKYNAIWNAPDYMQDDLNIHIVDINNDGNLQIYYDYLVELFSKKEIEYINRRLISIIEDAIENNDVDVENISIMDSCEKNEILYDFNNTDFEYNSEDNIIKLFKKQVAINPEKIALISNDVKSTYNQLDKLSDKIALYLLECGVKSNDNIAIFMRRNNYLVASLIAILKCGCSYIPIDPEYPDERVKYILNDSNTSYILTDNERLVYDDIINININNMDVNENKEVEFNIKKDSLAYIIYTSGSTGNPKGVMISNQNLVNFIYGINKKINITEKDSIVSVTTISFDIFGLELWLPLSLGATVVLANENEQVMGEKLNKICIKNNVNIIQTTPTKLKMLIDGNEHLEFLVNMRKIILGGENLPFTFFKSLKEIAKDTLIYNVYGPTETTIWSTVSDITDKDYITVGKPISNTKILIIDKKRRLLPIGIKGELAISGDSLSIGYYKKEELTLEKFIKSNILDKVIYITGDLALIDFNSEILILGRIDFQVKVNGRRIELEEIEKNISMLKYIKEAIVTLKNNKLICFYTTIDKNIDINLQEVRKQLYYKLPIYMIPSIFQKINDIPYTLNGKIDRKKLNSINLTENIEGRTIPETALEISLYKIWKNLIPDIDFDINTNFFEIADSLVAIKLRIELIKNNIFVEYSDIFNYPTIKELANKIMSDSNNNISFDITGYDKDFSDILDKNKTFKKTYKKVEVKNILVTGVTGFLGSHIVSEFIDTQIGNVYCIIRGKGNFTPKDRLKNTLNYFFGNKYDDLIGSRIIAIDGDITYKNFGIENLNEINNNIDLVIHSAACVKHYGDKSFFFDVNINGTKNVVDYCLENSKKLIHISTLSVSGNAFESANVKQDLNKGKIIFDETSFYKEQNVNNVYVYTKFKAEEYVLENIRKGLEANIIRCGNLTGRFSDLKFQNNIGDNAFANRIKAVLEIRKIPDNCYDMYLEFTPVDLASKFIIKVLEHFNNEHNMFHTFNHNHVNVERFLKILDEMSIHIDVIDKKDFSKYINSIMYSNTDTIKISGIVNDLNSNNELDYSTNTVIDSSITIKYMDLIGFKWDFIDDTYIKNYIQYLIDTNFINLE